MARFEFLLEVGLSATPGSAPAGVVWTDLTDRVLGIRTERGRKPSADLFSPGSMVCVLDDSDRALDPSNPDGLVPLVDGVGLPLCPMRLRARHDGGAWRPIFSGFLSEDPWTPESATPFGVVAAVRVEATEALGVLVPVSSPSWDEMSGVVTDPMRAPWAPDWWTCWPWPIDGRYSLVDGDELPDRGDAGGLIIHLGSGESAEVIPPATQQPQGVRVTDGVDGSAAEADVLPDGDEAAITVSVAWSSAGHIDAGPPPDEVIMSMTAPGGLSWDLACATHDGTAGALRARVWDPAGDLAGEAWIDPPGGYRFDTLHSTWRIALRLTATSMKLVVGGASDGSTHEVSVASTAGVVTAGDLLVGPAVVDPAVAGWSSTTWASVMVWRRALTDQELVEVGKFGVPRGPSATNWLGDTFAERLDRWLDAIGWPHGREWHGPDPALAEAGDEEPAMWAFGEAGQGQVSWSIGGQLMQTVQAWCGQIWTTRSGALRGRCHLSSIHPDHAADYLTPSAALTDAAEPVTALPVVRRSHPARTGSLLQRVINSVELQVSAPANVGLSWVVCTADDMESISKLGRRIATPQLNARSWTMGQRIADDIVARRSWPPREAHDITIDPMSSDDEWAWVLDELELERAVELTVTPMVGDPVVQVLQVQSERWQIGPGRAVVTVDLAES